MGNLGEDQRFVTFPHLLFCTFYVHLFENHSQNGPVDTKGALTDAKRRPKKTPRG